MLISKPQLTEEEFQTIARQLDALIQEFEKLPFPQVREMVFDLLKAVDAVHREGLNRLLGVLQAQGQADLVEQAAEADPIIRTLLLLYDFLPAEAQPQLENVRPGVNFIPLDQLLREVDHRSQRPVYKEIARLEEVSPGTMKGVEVDGFYLLVANVAGDIYAVRGQCPGSMAPLYLGSFSPPVVICPWHNEAYDVRTGERADGEKAPGLEVVPVKVSDGVIQAAVNLLQKSSAASTGS